MKQTLNILRGRLCLLLCLGLFAACSGDDDEQAPSKKTYPLTIEVAENPLIIEGAKSVATKAAISTTSTLSEFYMSYVYAGGESSDKETATKDKVDGKWKGGNWPDVGEDVTVNWYAYTCKESTPGTFYANGGNPYIDFTVEESATKQHDLLVATATDTRAHCNSILSFTFDHACSALRFYVKKATNLNDHTLSVTSIVLHNVVKQGEYYFNTQSWTPTTNSTTVYTLYSGSAIPLGSANTDYVALNGNFGSASEPYLFVIPQTLTAWTPTETLGNTYLELTCSIDGGSSKTAYIPFGATFVQGTQHDVKINIGKNSLYSASNTKIFN